jgi:hypothetical protein
MQNARWVSSVSTIPEEASDLEGEEEMASIESAKELDGHLQDSYFTEPG